MILLLSACTPLAQAPASNTEANKAVVRRAFDAFQHGDVAALNELFDPQGPWHTPSGTTIVQGGPYAELKASCGMCAALERRTITIDLILAEGDLVAVRSTWRGAYTGTFKGVAVSGMEISVVYTNVYRVRYAMSRTSHSNRGSSEPRLRAQRRKHARCAMR
jgi:ketosteroid isomerase-like protein